MTMDNFHCGRGCEDIDTYNLLHLALRFDDFFYKCTVVVDTAGHINHSNDKCPQWTEMVKISTITV